MRSNQLGVCVTAILLFCFGSWTAGGGSADEPTPSDSKLQKSELSLRTADEAMYQFFCFGLKHNVYLQYVGPLASISKFPYDRHHFGGRLMAHTGNWNLLVLDAGGKLAYHGSCRFVVGGKSSKSETDFVYPLTINDEVIGMKLFLFADHNHKTVDLKTVVCHDGKRLIDVLANFPAHCQRARDYQKSDDKFWEQLDRLDEVQRSEKK